MISDPKTGHFWSLFRHNFAPNGSNSSKNRATNFTNAAAKCRECCRQTPRKVPYCCYLHPMELPLPCHGTTISTLWNYLSSGTFRPLASRINLHSALPSRSKKVLPSPPIFPISADFCQEKRKKVTRSDQFYGSLSFTNSHVFSWLVQKSDKW